MFTLTALALSHALQHLLSPPPVGVLPGEVPKNVRPWTPPQASVPRHEVPRNVRPHPASVPTEKK